MSSAILYVAIVAIWGCVLIPRWLRRDSSLPATSTSSSTSASTDEQAADDSAAMAATEETDDESASAPPRLRLRRRRGREEPEEKAEEQLPEPGEGWDMPSHLAHRRVLSSRRRLLGMLVLLSIGASVLAGMRLAAWWVILPPSVILLGYLILLRAAARADAQRRELARTRTARAAVMEDSRALVAVPAAARQAEIIDMSASRGPGTQRVRPGQELYDQDADAKLRAVGD